MLRTRCITIAFVVLVGSGAALAEPKVGDTVGLDKGVRFYDESAPSDLGDYFEESESRGAITVSARWKVKAVSDGWVVLERRTGGLIEAIAVRVKDVSKKPAKLVASTPTQASVEECQSKGVCNVAIKKKRRFPDPSFTPAVLRTTKRVILDQPVKVCRLGPLFKLQPDDDDWLAPAAINWKPALGYTYELDSAVEILAGGKAATPPECSPKGKGINKVVVGGNNNKPQMGIFVLTKEKAKEVDDHMDKSLEQGYDHAMKVATKKWAGDRSFCEDAVRQSIGFYGISGMSDAKKWRNANFKKLKKKHWDEILIRNAWMFHDYAPKKCAANLKAYAEALRLAARRGLVIRNFGF